MSGIKQSNNSLKREKPGFLVKSIYYKTVIKIKRKIRIRDVSNRDQNWIGNLKCKIWICLKWKMSLMFLLIQFPSVGILLSNRFAPARYHIGMISQQQNYQFETGILRRIPTVICLRNFNLNCSEWSLVFLLEEFLRVVLKLTYLSREWSSRNSLMTQTLLLP